MPQDEFRIFLSAVSSEFGKARDAVAADVREREAVLRVQSDFRQEAGSDTTLRKLHDYIRDCSAVVCIIGERSGALLPPKAAEPFAHMLPSGIAEVSYTQWECSFARHFKRRLSIYITTDDYQPDLPAPTGEDPDLRRAFRDHIVKELGLDRTHFVDEDQLAPAVLKEEWPKKRADTPIALPYPSLGSSLFKGRDISPGKAATRTMGRQHPNLEIAQANYIRAFREIGRTEAETEVALKSALEDGREPPQ